MDIANIRDKYGLAFKRYIDFAIMYGCKSLGVNLSSSDLLDDFFDNHGIYNEVRKGKLSKEWFATIELGVVKTHEFDGFKSRREAKNEVYKKCFYYLEQRLKKNM